MRSLYVTEDKLIFRPETERSVRTGEMMSEKIQIEYLKDETENTQFKMHLV